MQKIELNRALSILHEYFQIKNLDLKEPEKILIDAWNTVLQHCDSTKFKPGDAVSSSPGCKNPFMPGVGEVIGISNKGQYICEHNDILYRFNEDEIYEWDPY